MDESLLEQEAFAASKEHMFTESYVEPLLTVTEQVVDVIVTNSVTIEAYFAQMGPKRDPLYVVIPITVVYVLIFLTGVIGNLSTCIVIGRNKSMHTATNYYLFSLAVSDLLLLVTGLPQEVYFLWSRYPYVFGEVFCVARGLAAETSANATVLTITAFTVERYVAICHPFLSHTMSKLSRAVKLILLIWLASLAAAIPQALQFGVVTDPVHPSVVLCVVKNIILEHSFELSTFLFFITPMTLITVLYALIGLRLRNSNMMKKESSASAPSTNSVGIRNAHCRHQGQSSRRVLKMLVAVVVAFFLCWAPFHVQRLVAIYGTPPSPQHETSHMLRLYEIVTYVSGVLYYLSTTINPMLYHLMSNKFRNAFKDTFARWCCCCISRDGRRIKRSYSALSQRPGAIAGRGGLNYSCAPSGGGGGGAVAVDHSTECSDNSACALQQCNIFSKQCTVLSRQPTGLTSTTSLNGSSVGLIRSGSTRLTVVTHQGPNNMYPRTRVLPSSPELQSSGGAFKFWKAFRCIIHRNADNEKPYNITPVDMVIPQDPKESFTLTECNISNSSLRDVDRGALEDELTVYMQELQSRDLNNAYLRK